MWFKLSFAMWKYLLHSCMILQITYANNYYWRSYTTVIPSDAVSAGIGASGDIYIGQGYLHTKALTVLHINSGEAYGYAVQNYTTYHPDIRTILCSPRQDNLFWMKSSNATFANDMVGKNPVIGGWESDNEIIVELTLDSSVLYIGRADLDGFLYVGKITGYGSEAFLYIVRGENDFVQLDSYEVLVYVPSDEL